jgi:hypothetical protein
MAKRYTSRAITAPVSAPASMASGPGSPLAATTAPNMPAMAMSPWEKLTMPVIRWMTTYPTPITP